jgi:hypothetical protein
MALAAPVDREFRILQRGHLRDNVVLANFRQGLRALVNPETGNPFTEDEIARATREKSRWYVEAQAIDDYGQGEQRNALYMADQIRVERASSSWLVNYHGRLFNVGYLPAAGGGGAVTARGVPGTVVVGSTTLNDPTAFKARDASGKLYQATEPRTCDVNGNASITMRAIDTGAVTNLPPGTKLTWTYRDPNMEPQATVAGQFVGGADRETSAELAARIASILRYRPGAGNDAHFAAWAREASVALEQGFVYPCALHAGSTIVAVTKKRVGSGPMGRLVGGQLLATAIDYLTPPSSPVVPPKTFVIVTPTQNQTCDVVLRVALAKGSIGGWTDAQPFPSFHEVTPAVIVVHSQTDFEFAAPADTHLPGAEPLATLNAPNAPQLMLWDESVSQWVDLEVASIEDLGPTPNQMYRVTLNAPPGTTITLGQFVSPKTQRATAIAAGMVDYFDDLGPGPLFDGETDVRGPRCVRFPLAEEEYQYRADATVGARVQEALGGVHGVQVATLSREAPDYPTSPQLGPHMLVLGRAAIYPL